jgi:ankyrin repeat protein
MSEAKLNFHKTNETAELGDSPSVRGDPHYEPLSEERCPLHASDSPLHKAAFKGDVLTLTSLISTCENIDARNYHNCTPLHLAIRGNHAEVVSLLLSAGADPSLEDIIDTALQPPHSAVDLAAWTGAQHAMAALINAGLEIPASAFERCASLNFVDCMETIFDKLSEADFSGRSRIDGVSSALARAACCLHLEAVEFLLTRVTGFPNRNAPKDQTALGQALASACDMESGMTPLHMACKNGYLDVVQFLLSKGAAVNEAAIAGRTPLLYITVDGEDECEAFPFAPIPYTGISRLEVAKILLDRGANIHAATADGQTVLHGASCSGDTEFIRYLVKHGANVRAIAANGETPLHNAARTANIEAVRYLIDQGADAHVVTTDGETMVHAACAMPNSTTFRPFHVLWNSYSIVEWK